MNSFTQTNVQLLKVVIQFVVNVSCTRRAHVPTTNSSGPGGIRTHTPRLTMNRSLSKSGPATIPFVPSSLVSKLLGDRTILEIREPILAMRPSQLLSLSACLGGCESPGFKPLAFAARWGFLHNGRPKFTDRRILQRKFALNVTLGGRS